MKIGIVTDTIACLTKDKVEKNDIAVVNLSVNSKDRTYIEHIDIDNELLFKLKAEGVKMNSSQPSPNDFLNAYEIMKEKGYTDIISIHPANCMSGTVNSARLGSGMIEGINVHIFEGMCGAFEQELYIDKALELINDGKEPSQILESLGELRKITQNYIVIEELMTLADSGRISKSVATIGNLVRLKPMIRLSDSGFSLAHKFRTNKKVLNQIIKEITDFREKHGDTVVYVTSINNDEFVNSVQENLKSFNNVNMIVCGKIGPVLSLNFGPKGTGICWSKA